MSECWWCHWGWPKQIRDIYDEAVAQLGGDESPLHFGPSHIVWEDENWECAEYCLENFDAWVAQFFGEYSDTQLDVVRRSLQQLAAVPDEYKHEPDGYPGRYPEQFPPPPHWEMVK